MEDMYVKPGNQERGWNDPPQFSYGLQMARGPPRNILNKRAAPPGASGAPPMIPPTSNPLAPPPSGATPPPLHPARPPLACVATPPPSAGSMRSQTEEESIPSEQEPDVDDVLMVLNRALATCRQAVRDQVCNDVAKRLCLLEDSWRAGRLSLPVRRRMETLSLELQSGHWDSADEIHRSLMVDHVTEVSQWMVGVKRLIAETRKLSPELLEQLQKPTEQVESSAEPTQTSAELAQASAEPSQASAEPVQTSAEPVQASAEPAQTSAEPAQTSAELVQAEPVQQSADPAQVKPVQDSADPVHAGTVQDSAELAQAKPVRESAEPIQDPVSQS